MRDFIRQFLLYSRSERKAVIALVMLIIMVIAIPAAYRFYIVKTTIHASDTTLQKEMAQWQKEDTQQNDTTSEENPPSLASPAGHTGDLFYFDPNTIGLTGWQKLGLSQKQAEGIEKYKSKGGQFRRPEDLRRLYSLTDQDKERLIPYVKITGSPGSATKGSYMVEINTGDSAAFEALWGIGPVLSARIVKYRTQLGGFVRVDQIGEVKGVRDSRFMEIRPHLIVNPALVHKININEADFETLRKHPYIHAKIAHAIIGYRQNKGKFENQGQLKELKAVPDEVYEKISPYLTL
ncbi:MAG: uptake protein and related DNA-binding protein [Bacteroidetes bacterium]|nr:uptake protein and related DNA-binding protein [Bacteroidota bacterium]